MKLRFQFRLRTLMIVVTVMAVAAWHVQLQADFVNERKELAREIDAQNNGGGGHVTIASEVKKLNLPFRAGTTMIYPPFPTVSYLRQWLGDDFALSVWIYGRPGDKFMNRLKAVFPEAEIEVTFE